MASVPEDRIVRRGDGETITDRAAREVRILATDEDRLTMTWSRYGHGERGPDLHVHREHTDAFYVLAGELTFALGADGERVVRAPAGTVVVVPPDVPHAFRNDGAPDAVFLNVHTPDAGFAVYMRALRDGAPARFDSYDLPVAGTRPAGEAIVAQGAYAAADLAIAAGPERVDVSVPGTGVAFALGDRN